MRDDADEERGAQAHQAGGQTVCAIVITYNRLDLLKECVTALRAQTRPLDAIVVVDNGSTDGSAEWLRSQADLIVATHPVNQGIAGALHTGIREAHGRGFEWFWFVDDDAFVSPDLLEILLAEATRGSLQIVSPLVVAREEPQLLAYRLTDTIDSVEGAIRGAKDGFIPDYLNPFNGLLMERATIDKIGTIKVEIFSGGEEVEYMLRARARGVRMATTVRATCAHPKSRYTYKPVLFHLGEIEIPPPPEERFWNYLRTLGYMNSRYNGIYAVFRDALKYSWYFLVNERFAIRRLVRFLRYYGDGIADRFPTFPERPG